MALLPFATITSLSEIAVPILKGAGKKGIQRGKGKADVGKGGTRIMFESIFDYGKFWWNDIVQEVADVRSKNLVELNRLNTQKLAFEVPMGEGINMFDNYNEAYTGFDSSGNFTGAPLDPGTQAMNNVPDYSQPTQSVFDEGGAFGGKQ